MLSYFKHKMAWQPFVTCYATYEESWADICSSMKDVFNTLHIEFYTNDLKEAVEYFAWENHAKGRKPGETDNTRFVRSGLPGSYKNEFNSIDHLLYFTANSY